jgi:hypothetical protein
MTVNVTGFDPHSSVIQLSVVYDNKCHWIRSTQFSNSAERGL